MPHLLDGTEPGADGVLAIARRALELRSGASPQRFDGTRLGAIFLNSSLRTRVSLEAAAGALGVQPVIVQPGKDAWALEMEPGAVMDGGAAEHISDAVRVLCGYVDLLAVRAFAGLEDAELDRSDPVLSAFVAHSTLDVINMESARWHPLQGLADTATWLSKLGPELRGRRLCLSWAPHPRALPAAVANQVLLSGALQGMEVTVAHPQGFDLDPQILDRASALATAQGGAVRVTHDQAQGLAGAQVVVAKSWSGWSGYGQRQAEATRRDAARDWQITADTMALSDHAGFMHCLPVRRNIVVSDAVLDGPRSWVFEQAHLRMWTAMALLERTLGGGPWTP